MATVLSISSQVVRGAIGNSAVRFALERMGHRVLALPTILLSNHPGHKIVAGRVVAPETMKEMLDALGQNGWLDEVEAVLTGYMPSLDHVAVAIIGIERIRERNPEARILVDPALGDDPKGVYVEKRAAEAVGAGLLPRADVITPNRFELEWLSGRPVPDIQSARAAAETLGPELVVATSVPDGADLANLLVSRNISVATRVRRRAAAPHGTGDLFAALFLGHDLGGRRSAEALALATAGVEAVLAASADKDELDLVASQDTWATPDPWPVEEEPDDRPRADWVAGVDGCPGGWIAVFHDLAGIETPRVRLFRRFADILRAPEAPRIVAVDIPIGLPERARRGGRACDVAARAKLGERQSSVFAIPARAAVAETDFGRACAVALEHSDPPRKVSRQCFNLFAKIREVDALMTPAHQDRIFECHPETAFVAMNEDAPLAEPKKVKSKPHEPGLSLRRALLEERGFPAELWTEPRFPASKAGPDDIIDACACAWTAARIATDRATRVPEDPPRDPRGLRMEIWS